MAIRVARGGQEGDGEEIPTFGLGNVGDGFHNGFVTADSIEERFRDEAGVADLEHVLKEFATHRGEEPFLGGISSKVLDFPGISLGIEKFFAGLVVFPK